MVSIDYDWFWLYLYLHKLYWFDLHTDLHYNKPALDWLTEIKYIWINNRLSVFVLDITITALGGRGNLTIFSEWVITQEYFYPIIALHEWNVLWLVVVI